jgi:hypothetical protein
MKASILSQVVEFLHVVNQAPFAPINEIEGEMGIAAKIDILFETALQLSHVQLISRQNSITNQEK